MVDSNDRERIKEANLELHKMLEEEDLREAVLLVLSNKQDLPNAMDTAEVGQELGLATLRSRTWNIQRTCATTGEGLVEGFEWLTRTLKMKGYSH